MQQSRFGVVGFGGEGVHKKPHFHTCGNNVLCSKEHLSEAVNSLEFTPQSSTFQPEVQYISFHLIVTNQR